MIITIHGLYIENKRVLMVRTKEGYDILPGGKPEDIYGPPESCLKREFREELNGTEIFFGLKYRNFFGMPPNSKEELCSKTYFCCPVDGIKGVSGEINEFKFVNSFDKLKLNLTIVSKKTLDSLIRHRLIK